MRFKDALIAWNPHTDQVRVGLLLSEGDADWTRHPIRYRMTGGATYIEVRKCNDEHKLAMMLFIEFNTLVVRDGIPVAAAHAAFLAINEYRDRISPDISGATPGDPWS